MENHEPGFNFWSRRRWLGRLSFSFLIIAGVLAYTAWRGSESHSLSETRIILYFFAAMLAFVLFLLGTRARHRKQAEDDESFR
ncbi:MAG TPA: hypothetical protein VFC78_12000 [Tepidisphaeraceae bacterium]|nr:hypothetical protein [Tepidisphaeraceae bacterium]